jgi:aromatic-L-amino-acid decarboxylase
LDPADWTTFREQAHRLLDLLLDHVEGRAAKGVWTPPPPALQESAAMPEEGSGLEGVRERLATEVLPYDLGNLHPRFFGWVHGAGTPGGILAGATEAALNANTGGRDHIGTRLERQVVRWFVHACGLPPDASGILTTGTSLATVIGLAIARERAVPGMRAGGAAAVEGQPRIIVSRESHLSISKAAELLGLGAAAIEMVDVDARLRMRPDSLAATLRRLRGDGHTVVAVVATLGTASTGAIDPLPAIADVAGEFGVWLHTDAAFGGLVVLSDAKRTLAAGLERSDSIAFDFHKWMHVTYAAGCLLVRNPEDHLAAFGGRAEYLESAPDGPAAAVAPWPMEYGPELSRGFRALRVWWTLVEHGRQGVARQIDRSLELARVLAAMVRARTSLELLVEPELQIVVFRVWGGSLGEDERDALNRRVVTALQRGGVVLPSQTRVAGRVGIRVAITNHRTTEEDLRILLDEVEREAAEIEQ